MDYRKTEIDGVYILEPRVFNDDRGYFFEAWKKEEFEEHVGRLISYKTMNLNHLMVC